MTLGIDIGGTGIKFGVVAEDYTLLETCSIPTNSQRDITEIIGDLIDTAKQLRARHPFTRIGIGSPGDIDSENGVCDKANNLPYNHTPVAAMVRDALQLPVYIANDANVALFGEIYAGIGRQYPNLIMITLGTGVGGGIAINGKPYLGSKGFGGEIGHMIIKYDGLPCPCGLTGCYEQYASVSALIQQTQEAAAAHPHSLMAALYRQSGSVRDVFTAKAQGCPIAAQVIDQYAQYIAIGLNSLENIFQPDAFVIGGAISNQEANLLDPIRAHMRKPTELFTSVLKNDAGVIGAAVVANLFAK